jgi:hypothetical protein
VRRRRYEATTFVSEPIAPDRAIQFHSALFSLTPTLSLENFLPYHAVSADLEAPAGGIELVDADEAHGPFGTGFVRHRGIGADASAMFSALPLRSAAIALSMILRWRCFAPITIRLRLGLDPLTSPC